MSSVSLAAEDPRGQGEQAHRRPEPERSPKTIGALIDALERIEQIIDTETAALRQLRIVDLQDFNNRKSRGLLDLTRAIRALDGGRPDEPTSARLNILRAKLEANQAALAMHLAAAKEITTIVAQTIRDSESDGTYSNSLAGRDKSPW